MPTRSAYSTQTAAIPPALMSTTKDAYVDDLHSAARHADGQADPHATTVADVREIGARIASNIERVIEGKHSAVSVGLAVLLAEGHLLIEDVPGVGKTMLARALARSIDGIFKRVQGTSDLLPSDITGSTVFDQKANAFTFMPGPVFANVVLFDEINRTGPKAQSALLEVMDEGSGEHGLADAGHVLDEEVLSREQRDGGHLHFPGLAGDDPVDVGDEGLHCAGGRAEVHLFSYRLVGSALKP